MLPSMQYRCAGHVAHSEGLSRFVTRPYVPFGQKDPTLEPATQKRPSGQSSGFVLLPGHILPAGQIRQELCPSLGWNVPGRQPAGWDDPFAQNVPVGHGYPVVMSTGVGDDAPKMHAKPP